MSLDICAEEDTAGAVFEIPDTVLDQLRALEAFKLGQHWKYFSKPSTLVRKESVEVGKLIALINGDVKEGEAGVKEGEGGHASVILDGSRGSGKSIMLVQAMTWALQSGWVVISIPNGMAFVALRGLVWIQFC